MVTIEDKLAIFNKIVYEYEKSKSKKNIEKVKLKNQDLLNEIEKKIALSEEDYLVKTIDRAKIKKDQIISKAEQDNRDKMLELRGFLLDDMIESIINKSKKIVASDIYHDVFIELIRKTMKKTDDTKYVFLYKANDEVAKRIIADECKKQNLEFDIIESKKVKIGGFIMQDTQKTFEFDMSFENLIENHSYEIGKLLYDQLR